MVDVDDGLRLDVESELEVTLCVLVCTVLAVAVALGVALELADPLRVSAGDALLLDEELALAELL